MSDIVEKTLAAFPKFLSEGLLGVGSSTNQSKSDVSTGFRQLISCVHKARSKTDVDLIVKKELSFLQKRLSQPNQSNQQVRETYNRLLFCLTLGYDVSFATIHAVKLAQQGTGLLKRYGYLMCCLLLHENHEMLVLLINTIQKDMKSSNLQDNCMSLQTASLLLSSENIPMFLPLVLNKLKHQRELVRIKAAHCLHQFYLKAPTMLVHAHTNFQEALRDKDPAVLQGIVQIYTRLAQTCPADYVHLGPSFLSILSQIVDRSFPTKHEYHSVPLPWLQIQLIKVLGYLGAENEELKVQLYPVLKSVIQKSTVKHNIAFAVLYECILTVSRLRGDQQLLNAVSLCVAKFLSSSSNTLKYLGIKALTALVQISPEYAVQHQSAVVECLDGEETDAQRKTLELLYSMANQSNVKAICSKLFDHLQRSTDQNFQENMAARIAQLAEKLSPDIRWYVETVNLVLQHTKGRQPSLAARLMNKLETEMKNSEDGEFEQFLSKSYLPLLEDKTSSESLLHLAVWVLGEITTGADTCPSARILTALCGALSRPDVHVDVKSLVLTSLVKLVVKGVLDPPSVRDVLTEQCFSFDVPQLQQKLQELTRLVSTQNQGRQLPPYRDRHKHLQYDFTLSFLDDYVCASLETNGAPYKPLCLRLNASKPGQEEKGDKYSGLYQIISLGRFDSPRSSQRADSFTADTVSTESSDHSEGLAKDSSTLKLKGVRRVWGREGLVDSGDVTPPAQTSHAQKDKPETEKKKEEDKVRRQQLAQALFEGIDTTSTSTQKGLIEVYNTEKNMRTSSGQSSHSGSSRGGSEKQSYLPSTDTSGWRAYSAKTTKTESLDSGGGSSLQGSGNSTGQNVDEAGFSQPGKDAVSMYSDQNDMNNPDTKSETLTEQFHSTSASSTSMYDQHNDGSLYGTPGKSKGDISLVSGTSSHTQTSSDWSSKSGESERREIWLANQNSPEHVQYEGLFPGKGDDSKQSLYDESAGVDTVLIQPGVPGGEEQSQEGEGVGEGVREGEGLSGQESLYSEYYNSKS